MIIYELDVVLRRTYMELGTADQARVSAAAEEYARHLVELHQNLERWEREFRGKEISASRKATAAKSDDIAHRVAIVLAEQAPADLADGARRTRATFVTPVEDAQWLYWDTAKSLYKTFPEDLRQAWLKALATGPWEARLRETVEELKIALREVVREEAEMEELQEKLASGEWVADENGVCRDRRGRIVSE